MPLPTSFPKPFPVPIRIKHASFGFVAAEVATARSEDFTTWQRTWQPRLGDRYDGRWGWAAEIAASENQEGRLCLAVRRGENLDALLSLSLDPLGSRLAARQSLLYIEYLAVAPDHQQPPIGRRLVRGLGRVLLATTVGLSVDGGIRGRVGLHSKLEPDTLAFYRGLTGLTELPEEDTEDGRWPYFEFSAEGAQAFIGTGVPT
jgi:hypothetical protein